MHTLGTGLFEAVIQRECSVFRQLKATYNLEYGLPFAGDAASLDTSNATGSFYQVVPWTMWFGEQLLPAIPPSLAM